MTAVADIGRPMSPPSIAARAVCVPVPRTVSGAHPTRTPADAARSRIEWPSGNATASGFSTYTFLPASIARSEMSACAAGIVRLSTVCTSGRASRPSTLTASAPGIVAATAADRVASRSASAAMLTAGWFASVSR